MGVFHYFQNQTFQFNQCHHQCQVFTLFLQFAVNLSRRGRWHDKKRQKERMDTRQINCTQTQKSVFFFPFSFIHLCIRGHLSRHVSISYSGDRNYRIETYNHTLVCNFVISDFLQNIGGQKSVEYNLIISCG